jgi:hypothetical protein
MPQSFGLDQQSAGTMSDLLTPVTVLLRLWPSAQCHQLVAMARVSLWENVQHSQSQSWITAESLVDRRLGKLGDVAMRELSLSKALRLMGTF